MMIIKMNQKKIITSKTAQLMAVAVIAASIVVTTMISGINNSQNIQKAMAEEFYPSGTTNITETTSDYKTESPGSNNSTEATIKTVNPDQTTNKEFWINTVHFDGLTNINAAVKCDTCPQNTPIHPAEQPPVNSTIPTGGGFRITEPNKVGSWDFRSFTFSPAQLVVNQGDKVTLHFIGVQGAHHVVTVDGVGTFELKRGQINTVSFVANNPGIINYVCHVHLPNMVGQILVLPKADI
jgi:plastocyanin